MIVRQSPRSSSLVRAIGGESAQWGPGEYLLAMVADATHAGNWQRAGKPHAPRPKPIPRPGAKLDTQKFGAEPIPIRDFGAWWDGP